MAKILFIAEVPPSDAMSTAPGYSTRWRRFAAAAADTTKPVKGAKRIAEGSWLLPADDAWSTLHKLASDAELSEVAFKVLLIEGDITELTKL